MTEPVPPTPVALFWAATDAISVVTAHGRFPLHLADGALQAIGGVEITEEQFNLLDSGSRFRLVAGELSAYVPEVPLATLIANALLAIDGQAEAARRQFLTPGSGQALEYQATQTDAERALNDPGPLTPDAYPWLDAERTAMASMGDTRTLLEIAQIVVQQQAAWTQAGAAIKAVRRAAKLRVEAATTASEVVAVLADLSWPGSKQE